MKTVILYFREYCSLCHAMRDALKKWEEKGAISLEIRDVDSRADWVEAFDELVPVLWGDGAEICHYHLDEEALERFLRA